MKKFEQHVHNRFDGREVKVDKNELWANISPQLDSTHKDRRKGWLFFLMGLTTGVALLSFFLFNQKETAISSVSNITTSIPMTTSSLEETTLQAETLSNQQQASFTKKEDKQATTNLNNKPTINAGHSNYIAKASTATIDANEGSIKLSKIYRKETTTSKGTNNNITNPTSNAESTAPFLQIATKEEQANKVVNAFAKPETEKRLNERTLDIPTLAFEQFANELVDEENIPGDLNEYDDRFITPQKSKLRFGIGVYTGVSKTQNTLQEIDQSKYVYTQLRASTEDQLQTVHLGLSALVEIRRNLYLQTGLEYSRINSRLNLDNEWILIDTVQNLLIRDGVVSDTIGAGDQFIFSQVSKNTTRNSFHLLDLPVLVGYQFGKARWRVGLEAGVFINLSLKKEGQIMSPDISMYDLKTDNDDWYETNVGIRPHFGIVSTYDLNNNYQLYFSTGMTFNQVFSKGNNPIKEQKSMFGIRLGGRYYF